MTPKTYSTERIFDAKINDVWRALTEKDLIRQWYLDLPEFKAEVGFVFEFLEGEKGGKKYLHHCEVTEVIAEKRLSYTWRFVGYEGDSLLTWELSELGDKTKLVLTHAGIETFPDDIEDFAFHNFEKGWDNIVDIVLKNFLEKEK